MSETQVLPPVQEGGKRWKAVMSIMAVIVLLLAVAAIAIVGNTGRSQEAAVAAQSGDSQSGEAQSETCAPKFVQTSVSHNGNKVDDSFAIKYAKMTADEDNISEGQRNLILEVAGADAQVLGIYAYSFGLTDNPNDWNNLLSSDKTCLSEEGQALWYQLQGAVSAKGTTFEEGTAPSNGMNSGVDGDQFVVASAAGVSGDLKAIKVTMRNGVVYIMVRCGNPVFPSAPAGIPTGKTDNPKPTPTPVKACPPGQVFNDNGICVVPKSNNVQEYQAPGRDKTTDSGTGVKPAVPEVSTPAQTSPPRVETQRTGGGGVIDTPTKKPGSETGVTAPGASTPAPARTAVPSPEPSVNPAPAPGSTEPPVNTGDPGNPFD